MEKVEKNNFAVLIQFQTQYSMTPIFHYSSETE